MVLWACSTPPAVQGWSDGATLLDCCGENRLRSWLAECQHNADHLVSKAAQAGRARCTPPRSRRPLHTAASDTDRLTPPVDTECLLPSLSLRCSGPSCSRASGRRRCSNAARHAVETRCVPGTQPQSRRASPVRLCRTLPRRTRLPRPPSSGCAPLPRSRSRERACWPSYGGTPSGWGTLSRDLSRPAPPAKHRE